MLRPIFLNKPVLLLLLFLGTVLSLSAQEEDHILLAQNQQEGENIIIQRGAIVKFSFFGYSGQIQEFKGRIDSLSDDSIYLTEERLFHPETFVIAVKDIHGFRGYSLARNLSKIGVQLALTAGNFIFYYGVIAGSLATGPAFLISVGTGLLSYGIIKILYPEKIKKTIRNGWSFKIIERYP